MLTDVQEHLDGDVLALDQGGDSITYLGHKWVGLSEKYLLWPYPTLGQEGGSSAPIA